MKICYINPTNNIRRPIAELSNILAKEGHKITVMFPSSSRCPTKNWVANDAIKSGNIKQIPIKSWYFSPLRYSFPNLIDLYKATKKVYKENDKVHIWEYYYPISVFPLLYLFIKGSKKQKKTVLTTDGFVGYSYNPKNPWWLVPAFKIYTKLFARFLFKIPQKMTTYGKQMLPHAKRAGVPMKKLKVLSTGIHLDKFQKVDKSKVQKLKNEFNITNEKVILYAGMLTERKGIRKIIKISTKLLNEGYNVKTLLVGDAHGENVYAKLVHPKYKDKIIFTGGRKEIPEFMNLATALLLPSEGEGLPGVVMEAMASNLPVVATNEGCTPDLIDKNLLVSDKNDYYFNLKKILDKTNYPTTENLNKIKKLSWKIVSKRYLDLYQPQTQAVILAAGSGTRMLHLTKNKPKCLLLINGEAILKRMLKQLHKNGINKVILVLGFRGEQIEKKIQEWDLDINFKIIYNQDYEKTNNIYSFWLARKEIYNKKFILLDGDVICEDSIITNFHRCPKKDVIAVDNIKKLGEEEMKVLTEKSKLKKISKKINPLEAQGEYLGMAKFSKKGSKMLFKEIKKFIDNGRVNNFCDDAFNFVVKYHDIHIQKIGDKRWIEMDTQEDYQKANRLFE